MYTTNPTAERGVSVGVIGAGPAGMMAAITAAQAGAEVTLYERNGPRGLGRKLGITGKGRCNLTNDATRDEFLENVPTNSRFLYAAFAAFPPAEVMSWFETAGVPLKVERGRRVFPASDRAADVVSALYREVKNAGVKVVGAFIDGINAVDGGFELTAGSSAYRHERIVLAAGGTSYQSTGSDGSGYALAADLGHSLVPPRPSLVPVVCEGALCPSLQGLSLKNVALTIRKNEGGARVYSDFGEMLFTHFGLSGPMVLSASAVVRDITPGKYTAYIDLKPALDEKQLDARLLRDFQEDINKNYSNAMGGLLPQKLIGPFASMSGIAPERKVNSITREERRRILSLLKEFPVPLSGYRPINEAIVTSGGIPVKEIDPKTMQSKLTPGLYFAGEIIDVDAYTGGYNLQIAWSTGRLAGKACAQ